MKELPAYDVSTLALMAMVASSVMSRSDKIGTLQSYLSELETTDAIKIGKYLMDPSLKKKRRSNPHYNAAHSILDWAETNVSEFENRWVTGTFKASQIKGTLQSIVDLNLQTW